MASRAGTCFGAGAGDAAGEAAGPVHRRVRSAAPALRGPDRRRRDGSRHAPLRDLRGSLRVLHRVASAVGLICLKIFGARDPGARQYAIDLGVALQLTNILRDVPGDMARGAGSTCRSRTCARFGCSEADLLARGRRRRPACARRRCRRCCGSRRRARDYYRRAAAPCRAATRGGCSWPPRSWAASTARSCAASSATATTCSPRASASRGPAARHRRRHLGTNRSPAVTSRFDVDRHRRRFRRPERRVRAGAPRRAGAGARRAAEARRTGDGVSRSSDRRARGQRPARAVRLLPRDAGVPRVDRRLGSRAHPAGAGARLLRSGRRRSVLRCPPLPAPLHLLAGVSRGRRSLEDRLAALRLAGPLLQARRQLAPSASVASSRDVTVQQWLDHHRQGSVLQEWLWHPLAVAALNQQPADAAAERVRPHPRRDVRARPDGGGGRAAGPAAARDVCGAGATFITARGGEVRTRAGA